MITLVIYLSIHVLQESENQWTNKDFVSVSMCIIRLYVCNLVYVSVKAIRMFGTLKITIPQNIKKRLRIKIICTVDTVNSKKQEHVKGQMNL
jgi:hypothetical protein